MRPSYHRVIESTAYTSAYYKAHRDGAISSARQIVPIVIDVIGPRSVVDIGCGLGGWLAVFGEHGVTDVLGVDGAYISHSELLIPAAAFLAHDLATPLDLGRRFDLAMSLEVAEHLPAEVAPALVRALVKLAPVVLFSAAVPGQGGVDHVNEQWPSYWATLFAEQSYEPVDAIRPRVWENHRVAWWYAQNAMLFISSDELARRPQLHNDAVMHRHPLTPVVHPGMYSEALRVARDQSLSGSSSTLSQAQSNELSSTASSDSACVSWRQGAARSSPSQSVRWPPLD